MALDPSIPLSARTANLGPAFSQLGAAFQERQERPLIQAQRQQDLEQSQLEAKVRKGQIVLRTAQAIRQLPIGQRAGAMTQAGPQLAQMGITEESLSQVDISDAGLDQLISSLSGFQQKSGVVGAEQRFFESNIAGLNPEDQLKARRVELKLDAPAVGSGAITIARDPTLTGQVAGSQAEIAGQKQTAKLEADKALKPEVEGAVAAAKAAAKTAEKIGSAEKIGLAQQRINFLSTSGKLNAQDMNLLKKTSLPRAKSLEKARGFRDALKGGLRTSGVGRRALDFLPIGVWTDQGSFDEIFNAFAEVAAREKLKASGEVRPTDADVQGMKAAMFGVGRSEEANIVLLNDFIEELEGLDSRMAAGPSTTQGGGQVITTKAQFDALPSGATYTQSNGEVFTKP